jgi:ssDNA-binding Zn-finger/Zn-ribbon topoisomerase 1
MVTEVKIFDAKEFINSLIEKEKTKKKLGFITLKNKVGEITEAYNKIYSYYETSKEHYKYQTCSVCGEKMRLVERDGFYKFMGCPNYKDESKGKHDTFDSDYFTNEFDVNSLKWLQSIKTIAEVSNSSISSLLDFIITEMGLSDIRAIFTGNDSEINDFSSVKSRAQEQEFIFNHVAKDYFTKLTPQFGMQIKTTESIRAKRRIADFVGSNDRGVFYIEIKNSFNDFNDDQFHETFNGVEFLLRSTGDNRTLFGCLYYFNDPLYNLDFNIIDNLIDNAIRIGGEND